MVEVKQIIVLVNSVEPTKVIGPFDTIKEAQDFRTKKYGTGANWMAISLIDPDMAGWLAPN